MEKAVARKESPSRSVARTGAKPPARPAPPAPLSDVGNLQVQRMSRGSIAIGSPNDPQEREAERNAERIGGTQPVQPSGGPPRIQRCACGGSAEEPCAECQAAHSDNLVQRALASPGQSLPEGTRTKMEAGLGASFADVKVHRGPDAETGAAAINARAFTLGNDIVMGQGEPGPGSPGGDTILAHELTHVVQQDAAPTVRRLPGLDDLADLWDPWSMFKDNVFAMLGLPRNMPPGPGLLELMVSALTNPTVQYVIGAALPPQMMMMLQGTIAFVQLASDVMDYPDPYIAQMHDGLGAMVKGAGGHARQATAIAGTSSGSGDCIWRHLEPKLDFLYANWWEVLKGMAWDFLWPWPGVAEDMGKAYQAMGSAWSNFWDMEISAGVDDLLAFLRFVNAAVGRLYGWMLIASVLIPTVVGAVAGAAAGGAGALPGAMAGFAAGLEIAAAIGYALLISTLVIEGLSIAKAAYNLAQDDRSDAKKECDCEVIASSALTVGICVALMILGAIASRLGKAILQRVANRVWRVQPTRRGRILEARFQLSELVRTRLRARSVKMPDRLTPGGLLAEEGNFPRIDLTRDAQITVRSQATGNQLNTNAELRAAMTNNENLRVDISGGDVVSVRSRTGASAVNSIRSDIRQLQSASTHTSPSFTGGSRSRVTANIQSPAQRIVVAVIEPDGLTAAQIADLMQYAQARGVRLQVIQGGSMPNAPSLLAVESIPTILAEIAAEGSRQVNHQTGSQGGAEETVTCELSGA